MGTDYKLVEKNGVELTLDEQSNRLCFSIFDPSVRRN